MVCDFHLYDNNFSNLFPSKVTHGKLEGVGSPAHRFRFDTPMKVAN